MVQIWSRNALEFGRNPPSGVECSGLDRSWLIQHQRSTPTPFERAWVQVRLGMAVRSYSNQFILVIVLTKTIEQLLEVNRWNRAGDGSPHFFRVYHARRTL